MTNNNTEKGFYHPSRGYWQTTGYPAQEYLDAYPEGTIEVELPPGPDHEFDGQQWVYVAPTIPPEMVKAEAHSRIVAFCPEWKQRNLTAQAAILAEKGRDNWSTDEVAAWEAGEAIWAQIAAIRAASDVIEADTPISPDFATDTRWPVEPTA